MTANAGYTMPAAAKGVLIKFSVAMTGVVVSTLLIYVGLTVYNKIRSKFCDNISPEEEVLKHPKTKDEAIKFYIRKNKI